MRFMSIYTPDASRVENAPPDPAEMARLGVLIDEMTRKGVLLTTEGLRSSASGAIVRLAGDDFDVTDGPFTETKELIAGYAIVQVKSKEEAIEWSKAFLAVMGGGKTEIRQMHEPADFAS